MLLFKFDDFILNWKSLTKNYNNFNGISGYSYNLPASEI